MTTATSYDQARLFDDLARSADYVDRRGWAHVRCPQCGKEPYTKGGRKASHFSFSAQGFGKCFACGFSCGLQKIAETLGVQPSGNTTRRIEQASAPRRPADWTKDPTRLLDGYLSHLKRLQLWQEYKPLSIDTIARFKLGVGVLPASQCKHSRLIVPVFQAGKVVAFRGRAYLPQDDDPKWLTCGSSQTALYNGDLLRPGVATVIVAENMIDCLIAMERYHDVVAVASTAGVATWRDEWTQQIAAIRPQRVIVWFDNDLAGTPAPKTYALLKQERIASNKPVTPSNGPKIVNLLLERRIPAMLYDNRR